MRNAPFLAAYLLFVTAANVLLKQSADAGTGWPFFLFLMAGNLAGFVGILAYTVGVQLAGGMLILREKIPARAWAGTCLILSGIVLISL